MNRINLYWPIYKNLEKEVIEISNYIHFDDDQLSTYSIHIGDLIIRCAVEIESLSKELYIREGGNPCLVDTDGKNRDLYFDTDCLELLNQKWNICKKVVYIVSPSFYFELEKNSVLRPLHKSNKRGSSGSKWKQAYQQIKHNRAENLKFANINNLLHALAALYLLNIYYRDESFSQEPGTGPYDFNSGCGSDIFSVVLCNATKVSISSEIRDSNIEHIEYEKLDEAVYVLKYTNESAQELCNEMIRADERLKQDLLNSNEVIELFMKNPEYKADNLMQLAHDSGVESRVMQHYGRSFLSGIQKAKREIILCKNEEIYGVISANI